MPQTTIYVSPRSVGAPDTRPPGVVALRLARLFAGSPALVDASVRVEAGRLVALTGPNGAGKTTLLRLLAGAIRPSFGSAEIDGLDVARHAGAVRERIAFLSHATGLYDELTARENLAFAAAMLGTPDPAARLARALSDVGLTERADERAASFSAGMRKRLALARILLGQPSVVLLDEPYAALDEEGMTLVDALLHAWRAAGVTVLVASHAAARVDAVADGQVRLDRGRIVALAGLGVDEPPPPRLAPSAAPLGVGS